MHRICATYVCISMIGFLTFLPGNVCLQRHGTSNTLKHESKCDGSD